MARLPLVSPLERALFLKAQPYLGRQPSEVLAALASYSEERFFSEGSVVRESGVRRPPVHFLATGAVEVEAVHDPAAPGLEVEAPGAVGLAHLFAGTQNAPGVRAVKDTLLLEIDDRNFLQIIEDHFSFFLQVARTNCESTITLYRELGQGRPALRGFEKETHASIQTATPIDLDLVHRLAQAKHVPFLQDTNLTVLGELVGSREPRRLAKGEAVWREGDAVDELVLILDGCARSEGPLGVHLAPAGAALGTWELFSLDPRIETWVADEPSRILPIPRALYTDLLEDHVEFAQAFLRRTSQDIVDAWAALARQRARLAGA